MKRKYLSKGYCGRFSNFQGMSFAGYLLTSLDEITPTFIVNWELIVYQFLLGLWTTKGQKVNKGLKRQQEAIYSCQGQCYRGLRNYSPPTLSDLWTGRLTSHCVNLAHKHAVSLTHIKENISNYHQHSQINNNNFITEVL